MTSTLPHNSRLPQKAANLSDDFKQFASMFGSSDNTDYRYLSFHYPRFASTLREFSSTWDSNRDNCVLDIGAHWLHQSVLWRKAGFKVKAMDLPVTLELENVKTTAREMDIELIPVEDLEAAHAFESIPDSSINIVLFTEIIEHLTFNPIKFWKQVYRVLAPSGYIVVTTPNYYAWNGRAWNFLRFARGHGGGISVDQILGTRTYGHHWREFSMREISRYFNLLSPDFRVAKAKSAHFQEIEIRSLGKKWVKGMLGAIPLLRPNLHIEIELVEKRRGILIEPSW